MEMLAPGQVLSGGNDSDWMCHWVNHLFTQTDWRINDGGMDEWAGLSRELSGQVNKIEQRVGRCVND